MAAEGYTVSPCRTGAEKLVAHKTASTQANVSTDSGKVVSIDDGSITVEYDTKPKTIKSYQLGRSFGKHEGTVFPHNLVTSLKVGAKFTKGTVLTYNENFFEPDLFNPTQVNWKAGIIANTVLIEGNDTFEDSSAIGPEASKKLRSEITKVKTVRLRFDQAVHDIVKVGQRVDAKMPLCIIENELTAGLDLSDDSVDTLRKLSSQVPEAKVDGIIDKIEVFYNGDFEDMSETILSLAKQGDRSRKKEAKASPKEIADNGRVDATLRIENNPVEYKTLAVRFYITETVPAIGGDKAVLANQMKTTFRRVMTGVNETESGLPIDIMSSKDGVDGRIVLSLYQIGTSIRLSQLLSEHAISMAENE